MGDLHCVMLGLSGPTFITDWAKAVSSFARVTGLTMVGRLPGDARRIGRNRAVADVDGFETVFVRRWRLRPVRLFWRLNARLEAAAMVAAIEEMDDWAPDIIHSHFFAGAAAVPRAAERLGIPFVHTEHTSHLAAAEAHRHVSAEGIKIMRWVFARAATVMLVGPEQLAAAKALGAVGNLTVVPNPVNTSIFSAVRSEEDPGTTLVTIGHLVPRKRHSLLLQAAALARNTIPDLRVEVIGDGSERHRLEQLVESLDIEDAVSFHGSCDRDTIADILLRSDLYVHTSERESFGVAIVEAMLTGIPVVAIRCGGVSGELLDKVGLVIDAATPRLLADAIVEAFANPDRFASPTDIAEWARSRYGFASVSLLVAEHYRQALEHG